VNSTDERVPLVRREAENAAGDVPAITDADLSAG
jgi:hypothetical protein